MIFDISSEYENDAQKSFAMYKCCLRRHNIGVRFRPFVTFPP